MNLDFPTRWILKKINKAIFDFKMIEDGDSILIAFSGGKDSLLLARSLALRKTFIPHRYAIKAIFVHSDFHIVSLDRLAELEQILKDLDIPLYQRHIQIKPKENDPPLTCYWCSWNRRKKIFETAAELGCNKVAFGHHLDDYAETILLNLMYHGRIEGCDPFVSFFGGKIIVIRPLIYLQEKDIRYYTNKTGISVLETECSLADVSHRLVMKTFLSQFKKREKDQILANLLKLGTQLSSPVTS